MAKLVVLGSGTSVSSYFHPFDFRYPSGYLLQHNLRNYLLDCSEGIRGRLERLKIDYYGLETVFITHFHPDHFNLHTLVESLQVRNYYSGDISSLQVFGPPEIESRFFAIWESTHVKGAYEKLEKFVNLQFNVYKDGGKIDLDELSVTPYRVVHGGMPAYALRFEFDGKVFTYSGDSGLCPGIKKASKGADFFLCEANEKIGVINNGHLNATQVGKLAKANKVKKLVLTHLVNYAPDEELIAEVRKTGFEGEVISAQDLTFIEI